MDNQSFGKRRYRHANSLQTAFGIWEATTTGRVVVIAV
jgi:hypothetical protein